MLLNQALFSINGGYSCGYVLKPGHLRSGNEQKC